MNIKSIGKLFIPKNSIFYELFENVGDNVQAIGMELQRLVTEPNRTNRLIIAKRIEDLEHKNDERTHLLFTELGRNFITPFDREDIHALATSLDDICDFIHGAAKKMSFYSVDPCSDTGIQKLSELTAASCSEIRSAIYGLRNMNNMVKMTEYLVRINSIENQADDVHDMGLEKLFEQENDVKTLIKKKEIYGVLETATDKCEDVANVIESIIIKYS